MSLGKGSLGKNSKYHNNSKIKGYLLIFTAQISEVDQQLTIDPSNLSYSLTLWLSNYLSHP